MKIKLISFLLIVMFVTIQTTNVTAYEKNNNLVEIEWSEIKSNSLTKYNKEIIDIEKLDILENLFSKIIDKISSDKSSNMNDILNEINNIYGNNIFLSILRAISSLRPLQKRAFIISEGYGPKMSILSRTEIKITQKMNFWYYKNNFDQLKSSRTLIIDPIPNMNLQFTKLIKGGQIGLLTNFIGFYLKIPGNLRQDRESHTFFFGYASKIRTIDLPDLNNKLQ